MALTTANKTMIIAGVSIIAIVLVSAVFWGRAAPHSTKGDEQVACTMEAKQCSDGSYVGRSGPKCEFAACPTSPQPTGGTGTGSTTDIQVPGTVTVHLGETVTLLGASASVTSVIEDSRCPVGVQCVWVGAVRVKIHATYGANSRDIELTLGKTFSLYGHSATLVAVEPVRTSTNTLVPSDYVFTFSLK